MPKITNYSIVTHSINTEVGEIVRKALLKGWQPFGPCQTSIDKNGVPKFTQTLVQYEEEVPVVPLDDGPKLR